MNTRFHPVFHFIHDGYGITGPDWGRSELVFKLRPAGILTAFRLLVAYTRSPEECFSGDDRAILLVSSSLSVSIIPL